MGPMTPDRVAHRWERPVAPGPGRPQYGVAVPPPDTTEGTALTDLSAFSDDERDRIMGAPGVVMKGAIVADGSTNALAFLKEVTAGAAVFRQAQRHENAFVKAVALALKDRGTDVEGDRELPFTDAAMTAALKEAEEVLALLRERGEAADADAYADWLVHLATEIARAVRSKEAGFFSRKVEVSAGERVFIEQLTAAVGR
jgi:hypothetical protein